MKTASLKKKLVSAAKRAFKRTVKACKHQAATKLNNRRLGPTTAKQKRDYFAKCMRHGVKRLVRELA